MQERRRQSLSASMGDSSPAVSTVVTAVEPTSCDGSS
jgi:hypothetical protein